MDWYAYEKEARAAGWETVCGCDEAGAGPLAGPVYAAAVSLPLGLELPGLDDSKKLTERRREALYEQIVEAADAWCAARVEAEEIDRTDILSARLRAMRLAMEGLAEAAPLPDGFFRGGRRVVPDFALIDGSRDAGRSDRIRIPHLTIVGGDGKSASIAAASILAKVSRDRYVREVLDRQYPQYQFARHKGYGTKLHYAMLDQWGPCPAHRRSFLKKWEAKRKEVHE